MRQEFHHRDRFQQIALELVQLEERIVPAIIYPIIGSDYSHNSILVKFNSAEHAEVAARELTFRPANAMVSKELASSLLPGLREITFDGDSTTVEQMMNWAAALPGVDYVEANNVYRMATTPNDTWFGEQYGLHNTGQNSGVVDADIDAKEAWDITTGSGDFVVAVIDTGVDYTHPDLAANIWTNPGEIPGDGIDNDGNGFVDDVRGWDFAGNDNDPMDDNGHGTHCAGIIGAVGNNAEGVTGVNWRVKIMVLKCFSSGFGGDSEAINSLNYAVAMGAKVSSNSYGGFGYSASFQNALANARSQGHLFVAGAGNNTSNNDIAPFYPASYADENIVSVAATTNSDQLSSFSNFGATTVDIAAPGSVILSTSLNGGYAYNSGTSMATPFVAGAAALIWDRYPQLSYHEVTERLYQSVDSIPALNGKVASNGRLNLFKAFYNNGPVAHPDTYSMVQGMTLNVNSLQGVLSNDTDQQNDPLTAQLTSGPTQGSLTLNSDGSFSFTPSPSFYGTVTFTYVANDLAASSTPATVTITVIHPNTPPVAQNDGIYLARPGVPLYINSPGVMANDYDPDGYPSSLTAVLSTSTTQGPLYLQPLGGFTYLPALFASGMSYFTYRVYDGEGYSQVATATIRVNTPATVQDTSLLTRQGTSVSGNIFDLAMDPDDDVLNASIVTNPTHGTVSLNTQSGLYTYVPQPHFTGLDSFTYRVHDGWEYSEVATISIRVDSLPIAIPDEYIVQQGRFLELSAPGILSNDFDNDIPFFADVLSVNVLNTTANGTLTFNNNGYIRYTPHPSFTGLDIFTYRISDGLYEGNTATVTLTVSPIPVAIPDFYSVMGNVLNVPFVTGVLANDTTPRQTPLTARLITNPSLGSVVLNANGGFSYIVQNGYTGIHTFTYVANDGVYDSLPTTVSINVIPVNHPPVAANDQYTTALNKPLIVDTPGVLGNDIDADNHLLTAVIVNNPIHGAISLGSDGKLIYTPQAGFLGIDQFTYQARDASSASNEATVTITVKPIPLANHDAYTTIGSTLLVSAVDGVLKNDASPNFTPLTSRLMSNPAHGAVTLNTDGSFTYTANSNYTGVDTFSYLAHDGLFDSQLATVTITVLPINLPPVASNDVYTTLSNTALMVDAPGMLANDADPENLPLTSTLVSGPGNGNLLFDASGSFRYTPHPGYTGIDTFTYRASDGSVFSNVATVTISVTPPVVLLNPNRRIILGQEQGGELKVLAGETGEVVFTFRPYTGFAGNIRVGMGDITGDGIPDIITAPGPSATSLPVRVYDGATAQPVNLGTVLNVPFGANYRNGIQVAVGDVNADGRDDIVLGADAALATGFGYVRTFDGLSNAFFSNWLGNFKPYSTAGFGGVRIAIGDVTGDTRREIITAPRAGTPTVRIFNTAAVSATKGLLRSFNAYSTTVSGGVFLAAANLQGDDKDEIITGAATNTKGHVRIFNGRNGVALRSMKIARTTLGPARVAAGDINGDGKLDLVVGIITRGSSSATRARVYDAATLNEMLGTNYLYGGNYTGGVFVAAFGRTAI